MLTPPELIDRLATLVPPPRGHRHRYYGVLAPHSLLRAEVTALALPAAPPANPAAHADQPAHCRAARYAWALLLALIYGVFPLPCPLCGADMRIIAFITEAAVVREILIHLGEPITPPTIAPARGPPRWEMPRAGQRAIDPQGQRAPALRVRSAHGLVVPPQDGPLIVRDRSCVGPPEMAHCGRLGGPPQRLRRDGGRFSRSLHHPSARNPGLTPTVGHEYSTMRR